MKYVDDAELKRIGNMTPFSIAIEMQDLRKELNIAKNNEVESKVSLSFELNNVKVLQAQLRTAESHKKTAMELCNSRATKINALETNLMEATKRADANMAAAISANQEVAKYAGLVIKQGERADKNYEIHVGEVKTIANLKTELRQANDLYMMVSNNNNHLNKVIEDLKAAPAIPKHATWEAIAEREKELKCEAFRRINELEAEVAAWKCNSCSDNCIKDNKELQSKYDKLKDGIEQICSDNGIRE